jgi:hypothetical protein
MFMTTPKANKKSAIRTLSAAKVRLPDVPRRERKEVRKVLAPLLSSIVIKAGDCWNNSQQLMTVANNPRVGYVEGVYEAECKECECGCNPIPHGWNTVDGHLVDLTLEFRWFTEPTFNKNWLHEPFKEFTQGDIEMYIDNIKELDTFAITPLIFSHDACDVFGLYYSEEEYDHIVEMWDGEDTWEELVFKPATDRMLARYAKAAAEPKYIKDAVWQNEKYLADLRQRKKEFEYPTQMPMFPIEVAA